MGTDKELIPQFETEEQEAEYWDTHSPLDLVAEPKAQKVRVRGAKDRSITIRLDSESRSKLDKLAVERGLGPSTFARVLLYQALKRQQDEMLCRALNILIWKVPSTGEWAPEDWAAELQDKDISIRWDVASQSFR